MSALDSLKQFIAWIGGALGALSVMFYAAGYLAHRAHVNMLGLNGVLSYTHDQLLYEGAKFFFTVGAYSLNVMFATGLVILITIVALMFLRQIRWINRVSGAVTRWVARSRNAASQRHPRLTVAVMLGALGVALVLHTERFFYPLQDLYAGVENVLYARSTAAGGTPCGSARQQTTTLTVTRWLLLGEDCRGHLLLTFRDSVIGYLILLAALAYANGRKKRSRAIADRIVSATLLAYGCLYTLLLPAAFGILVRSPIYPEITVKPKGGAVTVHSALHLLDRTGPSVLVWDRRAGRATWLPPEAAAEITVHGQSNLLKPLGGKENASK